MNLEPHVFISHKTQDREFAQEIIEQLKHVGTEVWIAPDNITPGQKWIPEIDSAIEQAFVVIVILTPKSLKSQWVTYEWSYALSIGKNIIPIKLEKFNDTRIHEKLREFQYKDFVNLDTRPSDLKNLVEILQDIRSSYSPASLPMPRYAPPSVKKAIIALDSHFDYERKAAVGSLAQINHPTAVEALNMALKHLHLDVRIYSAFELTKISPTTINPNTVVALIEALRYGNANLYESAKNLLIEIGEFSVPSLVENWHQGNLYYVDDAIEKILLEIGKPAIPYVAGLLKHDNRDVRLGAVRFLADTKDEDATPSLVKALDDIYGNIRLIAVQALGRRKSESAIPKLKELLADNEVVEGTNHPISFHVSVALYRIGTQEAYNAIIPYLKQQLSNTKLLSPGFGLKRVCDEAAEILDQIGTPEDKAFVAEWRRNHNKSDD